MRELGRVVDDAGREVDRVPTLRGDHVRERAGYEDRNEQRQRPDRDRIPHEPAQREHGKAAALGGEADQIRTCGCAYQFSLARGSSHATASSERNEAATTIVAVT